jgi:hypothetical protein
LQVAFLEYLQELGIDEEFAKLGVAVNRQRTKGDVLAFLKEMKGFLNDEEEEVTDGKEGEVESQTNQPHQEEGKLGSKVRAKKQKKV